MLDFYMDIKMVCRNANLVFIIFLLSSSRAVFSKSAYTWSTREHISSLILPQFRSSPKQVESLPGQTALLHCTVQNLGDRMVSWIRTRDLQILTAGPVTFTADPRFSVAHGVGEESWGLVIKKARTTDSGQYECQVNTDPKMNYNVTLIVRERQMGDSPYNNAYGSNGGSGSALISGPREQLVKRGSTVTLECSASIPNGALQQGGTNGQIMWLKDGRAVSFQAARGGISVNTEWGADRVRSTLTVALVESLDSGKYSCQPPRGAEDVVSLIVIEGERSEAMQRSRASSLNANYIKILLFSIILVILVNR